MIGLNSVSQVTKADWYRFIDRTAIASAVEGLQELGKESKGRIMASSIMEGVQLFITVVIGGKAKAKQEWVSRSKVSEEMCRHCSDAQQV